MKETLDIFEQAIKKHSEAGGKLRVTPTMPLANTHDLSIAYTPGVAGVCEAIAKDPDRAYELTIKKNTVAIVTDGSAVLGLGNIGPEAALPVMEGKALLFKEYANVDAFPICVKTQDTDEIIELVKNISPVFAGINLEDISGPRCFEIEERLQDIGIPVFHDDQHGTSITFLGALINSVKLAGKSLSDMKVVINGAGAAGNAIAELLLGEGGYKGSGLEPVQSVLVCDSRGIIYEGREDIKEGSTKHYLATITNRAHLSGSLEDAMVGADVFVGVSVGNVVSEDMVRSMNENPLIFAMANPIPEIMPDAAKAAGAFIVGTGRSDFPNQVNNVLIFPGIFRGAIDARAKRITASMKVAAAFALAESISEPTVDKVLPQVLDKSVGLKVADAVREAALTDPLSGAK